MKVLTSLCQSLCKPSLGALLLLVSTQTWSAEGCINHAIQGAGLIATSGFYSEQYRPQNAFDEDLGSMWISAVYETPAWISFRFPVRTYIDSYSIDFRNGSLTSRAPKDFELQGRNYGDWVTIDTRSDETGWLGVETRTYFIAKPGAYRAYRLLVTDDNDLRQGVVVVSMGTLALETCTCEYPTSRL